MLSAPIASGLIVLCIILFILSLFTVNDKSILYHVD